MRSEPEVPGILIFPFVCLSLCLLWPVKNLGFQSFPVCKRIFLLVGAFPVGRHFYEPLFDRLFRAKPLDEDIELPGAQLNDKEQLELLFRPSFGYGFKSATETQETDCEFNNHSNASLDTEFLGAMIPNYRPRKVLDTGGGYLAKIASYAARVDDNACKPTLMERYERL